jgi:hypothetical protein
MEGAVEKKQYSFQRRRKNTERNKSSFLVLVSCFYFLLTSMLIDDQIKSVSCWKDSKYLKSILLPQKLPNESKLC